VIRANLTLAAIEKRSFVAEAITARPDAASYFSAAAGRLKRERFIDVREGLPFPRITKWT
jgi:hypothetical protein